MTDVDYDALATELPEEPPADLAAEAVPADDPGPTGSLTVAAPNDEEGSA